MFRRKTSNSEENLFNIDQKNVKTKINQNLAHTVKELQKEYPLSSSPVQSDSSLAQYLCSVLESAFIHGLKVSYFEKDSTKSTSKNNFPKPQFWNLIIKISHAETVNRVQALTYITSRIGKCRAWLRLTLNDGLVTSYLASIFSKDQKSILSHYYDQHALFLDHEHADIFLRYLQGVESVVFDLSYNSSMLNQWTKTPLELAGLVPPSTTAPLYLGVQASLENNNYAKSLTNKRSLIHRASAPALLRHELYSHSFPSSSAQKKIDEKDSSVAEENDENGGDEATDNVSVTDTASTATPTDDDVLHKRHLMKKRKRRKKLSYNETGVRIMSSWSSLSSGESITSGSNNSSRRNTPRSGSFCNTPPTTVLTRKANEMAEKKLATALNESQAFDTVQKHSTPKKETQDNKLPSPITTPSKERANRNLVLPDTSVTDFVTQPSRLDDSPDSHKSLPSEGAEDQTKNPQGGAEDSLSTLEESTGSLSSSHVDSKLGSQMPLPNAYKLSYVTSSGSMSSEEESKVMRGEKVESQIQSMTSTDAIDIYSAAYQHETQIPQNGDLQLNLSTPRGIGNSLSMGGGWSSDQSAANTPDTTKMSRNSSGVLPVEVNEIAEIRFSFDSRDRFKHSNSRTILSPEKESDTPEVFIRREGYLKKMGAALKLWKKRWFVLRGTIVTYYKDKNSRDILGTIDLTDVLTITEESDEDKADVVIVMNAGTKHYLAADDKKLTLDWASDFLQVISGGASPKESSGEHSTTQGTSGSTEYLEEYEVISVRNHLLNGTNTSWHASMIAHMSRIANEKGLDSQNYQCADCASPIGIIYGPPRLCAFTGQYYCSQCHANEETQIPARMIHNWDFRKHKVSKRSKSFLEQVYTDALINLSESNPGIYKYIDEMGKLLQLREQLKNLKPYLQTCRSFDLDDISNRLGSRLYFLDDCHLYSVQDLCAVQEKTLGALVSKVVSIGTKHVYGCTLCTAKGFLCEICHSSKVIFPFETESTVQCYECKSVFHQGCKTDSVKCPKCERRQMRCLRSIEDMKDLSTSDSENEN